jgi:ribonuclease G
MKGRIAVLDQIDGREAAALIVNGRLEDLLIDPPGESAPRPGAIYRAIADRPLKGQNGMMLKLGGGRTGFLRQAKALAPGQALLVQVSTWAEAGKAAPVTSKLLFKGRTAILTPGAKGLNIARSIRDEGLRDWLAELAHEVMVGAPEGLGLILRTAAASSSEEEIAAEIAALRETCAGVLGDAGKGAELLMQAPSAHYLAWRDWSDPAPDQVIEAAGGFTNHGVLEMIDDLHQPYVKLGQQASMYIEPTRALVAVDVNTGGDFSYSAGLKANLATARDLPRQLRLRGLGGQVVVDLAPMGKKDRPQVEVALKRALKADGVDTILVGWTPLGHLELQRKRERLALALLLAE